MLLPRLSAAPRPPSGDTVYVIDGLTMGTTWRVRAVGDQAMPPEGLREAIEAELVSVIAEMSHWEPSSLLSQFNAAPAGTWTDLPPAFAAVMDEALRWAELSDGAIDPTLGALVDLWGFGPPGPRIGVPTEAEVTAARAVSGRNRLERDGTRIRQPGGLRLDLSGIAKGHAADRVSDRLQALGVTDHLVEIGGELKGLGVSPDGMPWWVALEAVEGSTEPRFLIGLHGLSVATSGDARWAHTIDGRTGRPIANDVASVSVIHPCCMTADALATALTVLGPKHGLAFAATHDIAALIVSRGERGVIEHVSPAFADLLEE